MSGVVLKDPVRVPDRSLSSESRSTPVLSTPVTSCVPVGVLSVMLATSLLMLLPATVTVEVIPETLATSASFLSYAKTRRPAGYWDRGGRGLAGDAGRVVRRARATGEPRGDRAGIAPRRRIDEIAHEHDGTDEVREGARHVDADVAADCRGIHALDTLRGRRRDRREDHVGEVGEARTGARAVLPRPRPRGRSRC